MNTAITGVQTSLTDVTRTVTGVMDQLTRLEKAKDVSPSAGASVALTADLNTPKDATGHSYMDARAVIK
uniref:Uncharacterized protein n=1 Tax=Arundo donax TaxID=35708 RepID=A0A0A9C114_ARUDO